MSTLLPDDGTPSRAAPGPLGPDGKDVVCPLCKTEFKAQTEEACVAHIASCGGFTSKHGAAARESREAMFATLLPAAEAAARGRTAQLLGEGGEMVTPALIQVMESTGNGRFPAFAQKRRRRRPSIITTVPAGTTRRTDTARTARPCTASNG